MPHQTRAAYRRQLGQSEQLVITDAWHLEQLTTTSGGLASTKLGLESRSVGDRADFPGVCDQILLK